MLKYLVHLTAPVISKPSHDNLRGEPRWERNVVGALLAAGRQIHTTMPNRWTGPDKPSNFYDGYNPAWADESVLITHAGENSLHIPDTYLDIPLVSRYRLIQFFGVPSSSIIDKFNQFNTVKLRSAVATTNFVVDSHFSGLQERLGPKNAEWVQGPAVPFVDERADNFGKPYLLWLYRNFWSCASEDPSGMRQLIHQIASYMRSNPELRIGFIIGAWDQWAFPDRGSSESLTPWAYSFDCMQELIPLRERVDIYCRLDWAQVLELISRSHLVFSPPEPLGGPPYEGAMYGVPAIVSNDRSPFHGQSGESLFPELLRASKKIDTRFLSMIDRLFTDHSFYRSTGSAYRTYVKHNATYEAYVRQLDKLAKKRGWGSGPIKQALLAMGWRCNASIKQALLAIRPKQISSLL